MSTYLYHETIVYIYIAVSRGTSYHFNLSCHQLSHRCGLDVSIVADHAIRRLKINGFHHEISGENKGPLMGFTGYHGIYGDFMGSNWT